MRTSQLAIALAFAAALPAVAAVKESPSWVQEVSSRTLPAYPGKVPAAVILEEQRVTVDASGALNIVTRRAVKILTNQGRREAEAIAYYFKNGRQVKQLRAWLIAPNGFEKTFDKNSVADLGAFNEMELYNDIRYRLIKAENPEIGSVFAYESEVDEKALFAQDDYDFQDDLPVVQARYVLTLPAGWQANAAIFNHAPIQPVVDGGKYVWELKDLPYREPEVQGPSMRGLAPRLAVNFYPGPGAAAGQNAIFKSWNDVSRWQWGIAAGQDGVTPEIAAKTSRLTADAKTEYEKIRAIGRYVQQIRYVAIEMDIAHGGGYKPHSAGLVFEKQYGDCKDKANLMRAMLKSAGITAYLVAIFSGDRTYVREEWPSPHQFNHMILAARVSDATVAPAVMPSPLGRLLIFDPTDDTTPMGDLPWYEQSSLALLCAGDKGGLLKMPATKPEDNGIAMTIDASLTAEGDLTANFLSAEEGQPAQHERARHAAQTTEQYRVVIGRILSARAKGLTISKLETEDLFDQNAFRLKVEFASRGYGQLMQGRLLVFSPAVVVPAAPVFPQHEKRTSPIVLRAVEYKKNVRVKLPEGFEVDEMPAPLKFENEIGRFSVAYKLEQGQLLMQEELRTEAQTLAAEQFPAVKKFFDEVLGADSQNAVLVKK